ncbi:hypothetical protein BDZ89DRAFT_1158088 [Hymenopellis radicata]|nr:hypothetical protein BDZ89DRAFT_1158088 [Hymenopellis radicata]
MSILRVVYYVPGNGRHIFWLSAHLGFRRLIAQRLSFKETEIFRDGPKVTKHSRALAYLLLVAAVSQEPFYMDPAGMWLAVRMYLLSQATHGASVSPLSYTRSPHARPATKLGLAEMC